MNDPQFGQGAKPRLGTLCLGSRRGLQSLFTDLDCRNDQNFKIYTIHPLVFGEYVSRWGLSDFLGLSPPSPCLAPALCIFNS